MSYEITFTRGFKEGLESLPRDVFPIIDRQVRWISTDPFQRDPNRTPLKNASCTYRVRIGLHVRMLYRVSSKQKRIEFYGIGGRDKIYDQQTGGTSPLTPQQRQELLAEIRGQSNVESAPKRVPAELIEAVDLPVVVEALDWISEDELFLLHIPTELWPSILSARSVDGLKSTSISEHLKLLLEDYWTNPAPTQVDKLYSLTPDQGADSIAQRPLSQFLIVLDPEQKAALYKIKGQGPYLLKGSAGTGKSLVGLYHIRDSLLARAGESLFGTEEVLWGSITYTNTLVDANRALLQSITPASIHGHIHCTTLDKLAYSLAKKVLGHRPSPLNTDGISKWIKEKILPQLSPTSAEVQLFEKLGSDYIAEEIEQVIIGNGLEGLTEYLALERRGRKRGLRASEREAIWTVHDKFTRLCEERKVQTFGQWRVLALNYLKGDPNHSRYTVLFVDEAQDLSKVARQLCLELVRDPRNLLIASDSGQSIYTVPLSWRQCDSRFDFRQRRPIQLERSYRATWQIGAAIAPLRADPGDEDDKASNATPVFTGPLPLWRDAPQAEHSRIVCEEILKLLNNHRTPINAGQIGIIVRDSRRAETIASALKAAGIPTATVEKQTPLRLDEKKVHIITAHSSKGLGFPVVIVPDVHNGVYPSSHLLSKAIDAQHREQIMEAEQRLLYVALSRASHRLIMISDSTNPSSFLSKFDRTAHWS